MKIAPSGSRVIVCGQTEVMELIVSFRNFAKTPEKNLYILVIQFIYVLSVAFAVSNH